MARRPISQLQAPVQTGRTPVGRFTDTGMVQLNPDDNVLGVKSKSVLGDQPKGIGGIKGFIAGTAKGFATGTGATLLDLAEKGARIGGRLVLPKRLERELGIAKSQDFPTLGRQVRESEAFQTSGFAEKAGSFTEQIGEFFLPAGAASKLGKGKGALNLGKRMLSQGAAFGGVTALQEGEINKEVGQSAVIGAAFPAAGAGFKGVKKLLRVRSASPKVIAKARGKAEKLATEILQPSKADIKVAKLRGASTSNSVKEYVKSVEVAKNFDDSIVKLKSKLASDFAKRNEILKKGNFQLKESRILKELSNHIKTSEQSGLVSKSKLQGMREVLKSEKSWLKKTLPDRIKGQARKELIYKEARPIYEKIEKGTAIGNEEGRVRAFELLGKGYKKVVEAGDDTVRAINATYGAKQGAIEMLAGRSALAEKALTPTVFQNLVSPFVDLISQATGAGSASFITKLALKQEKNLFKLTKKLVKLSNAINKGESQKEIARQLSDLLGKKVPQLTIGKAGKSFVKQPTIRIPQRILDETQRGLKPKSGKPTQALLPKGTKSGKPIALPKETLSAKQAREALRRSAKSKGANPQTKLTSKKKKGTIEGTKTKNVELLKEARKFKSSEDFLRSGGPSNKALEKAAFGFTSESTKTLKPSKADIENVEFQIKRSGLTRRKWAEKVDLSEPIDVVFEKGKFFVDDGHHRFTAAKELGKKLKVNLQINDKAIEKITGKKNFSYDDFVRDIWKQANQK